MIIIKQYPKLLYLDHNKWVKLEEVYSKKKNAKISTLIDILKKLIKEEKLRIVANLTNFQETTQRKYGESRMELADFLIELTNGYFFAPYVYLMDVEIRNYFRRKMEIGEVSLRGCGIGKGFGHLMGAVPKAVINSIDPKILEQVNKEAEKHFLKNEFLLGLFEKYNKVDDEEKERYIKEAEIVRQKLLNLPNDLERKKNQINVYFENYFMPKIMKAMLATDISTKEGQIGAIVVATNIPRDLHTYKERHNSMKEFPMMYSELSLTSFRDRDIRRNVKWNDLMDIASLCFPIAYFDFVIAEKYFITLAKQAKLDRLYNTVLLNDLLKLNDLLINI